VATEFHRAAFRESENLPRVFRRPEEGKAGVAPERVARATLRALRWNRREIVVPWRLRLAMAFRALFPAVTDAALGRMVSGGQASW
jgi:short-subunit dehydrogenase